MFSEYKLSAQTGDLNLSHNYETAMPEPVANNAVCADPIGGKIYSFSGIDSTLSHSGIHLKSWRYDIQSSTWESLPDLPDTLGKVAAAASYINDIIYIVGGYHVFPNGSEVSSKRVHRFDCVGDTFMTDAADLPLAIDDHVQSVWRDSLLFVITGWSNNGNKNTVQIYDPNTNTWTIDYYIWNQTIYSSFGASGTIVGDKIYYLGGARFGANFPLQNYMRTGQINPSDLSDIQWSDTLLPNKGLYRAACIHTGGALVPQDQAMWLGGSSTTYNYDAVAYNGSGVVSPSRKIQLLEGDSVKTYTNKALLMDYRGAVVHGSTIYLCGGIDSNAHVSNQLLRLVQVVPDGIGRESDHANTITIYPNPGTERISFRCTEKVVKAEAIDKLGAITPLIIRGNMLNIDELPNGSYILRLNTSEGQRLAHFVKH